MTHLSALKATAVADTNYTSYKAQSLCMCEEAEASSLKVRGVKRTTETDFFLFLSATAQRSNPSAERKPRDCFVAVQVRWVKKEGRHLISCQFSALSFWWQIEAMEPYSVSTPANIGTYDCTNWTYSSNTRVHICTQAYFHTYEKHQPSQRNKMLAFIVTL